MGRPWSLIFKIHKKSIQKNVMKHTISHKICIVLALVTAASLALASITGSTLAYLTDNDATTNNFTFRALGDDWTDTVNYYFRGSNGNYYQITDSGYQNVPVHYRGNELICANNQNTKLATPPNGFELSYIMIRRGDNGAQTRVNAGDCIAQPDVNDIRINVYFAPITYTIAYDFNGYNQSDITFTDLPLQSTYTVYDMIKVPYDAAIVSDQAYDGLLERAYYCYRLPFIAGSGSGIGTIRCEQGVPGASVDGNTLLGWEDQNGVLHGYDTAGTNTSWSTDLTLTQSSNNVYSTFAARTSGNLTLTARWEIEIDRGTNNINSLRVMPEKQAEPENIEVPKEQTEIETETSEDAANVEAAETGGEKKEELREDENTATE